MSDTRLRKLERRWRSTGAPDDEEAYQLERLRVGSIDKASTRLAAACGSPVMRKITGDTRPPVRLGVDSLSKLLKELSTDAGYVRAGMAACVAMLDTWKKTPGRQYQTSQQMLQPSVRNRVLAAARMIVCPCVQHEQAIESLQTDTSDRPDQINEYGPVSRRIAQAVNAVDRLLHLVLTPHKRYTPVVRQGQAIYFNLYGLHACSMGALGRSPMPQMTAALVEWILGNDPLPALLARLEAEAASDTPITPPG